MNSRDEQLKALDRIAQGLEAGDGTHIALPKPLVLKLVERARWIEQEFVNHVRLATGQRPV